MRGAGLSITLPTAEDAVAIIARERMKPNFGNAGSVDNALTRAKERMQSRLTKTLAAERAAADLGEAPPGGTRVNQSLLLPEDFDKNPADFSKVRHTGRHASAHHGALSPPRGARPTRVGSGPHARAHHGASPPSPQVRVALDDLVDVDFIHEYFDELEASLSLAKEVKSACTSACTSNGL